MEKEVALWGTVSQNESARGWESWQIKSTGQLSEEIVAQEAGPQS